MKRFLGRTALVTGASRGIGAEVARMMAEQGADVVINYRSKGSRAEHVAAQVESLGRRALMAQADLTQAGSVEATARAVQDTQAGVLPTVQEFAAAIVDAAADIHSPNGHVSFVGSID